MKASETLVFKSELVFDETAHRYYLDGTPVPNVTRVLEAAGLTNYDFLGALREEYLARGRAVHEATHRDDNHDLAEESVSAEILGFVEAWRRFRRDFGFVPHLIEHKVCNPQYGYAGCIDRVGRIRDGTEFILDIKIGHRSRRDAHPVGRVQRLPAASARAPPALRGAACRYHLQSDPVPDERLSRRFRKVCRSARNV